MTNKTGETAPIRLPSARYGMLQIIENNKKILATPLKTKNKLVFEAFISTITCLILSKASWVLVSLLPKHLVSNFKAFAFQNLRLVFLRVFSIMLLGYYLGINRFLIAEIPFDCSIIDTEITGSLLFFLTTF